MTNTQYKVFIEGASRAIDVSPEVTLLEAMRETGFVQRTACRNGVCEICEADLIEGKVWQRYPKMDWDASQGECRLLLCTSYPRSDIKLRVLRCLIPEE